MTITKPRTLALLLVWLALIFGGCRSRSVLPPEPAPPIVSTSFERLSGLLPGVQGSDVTLHEGLPDAFWDPDLREKELNDKKTVRLQSYPFYEEPAALKPESGGQITAVLSVSGSYTPHSGPKSAGEYNADYGITWKGNGGETRALVSLECSEVKLFGPKSELHCDLTPQATEQLKQLLQPYRKNRPAK